jgi:tRNA A37 threonylcarbamoyladenosine dehydratase
MEEQFVRLMMQIGRENLEHLQNSRVAIFGIGGVGGYCTEALVRSGIGSLDLFDHDQVSLSNLNRQIIATHKTIGQDKVAVMKERILDINPDCSVEAVPLFYGKDTASSVDLSAYDYVVDAVDNVTAKLELAVRAYALGVPIISAMGAGNKMDPTKFQVADIYSTSVCPLAKVMRRELRKRGVGALKVVYSTEMPLPLYEEAVQTRQPVSSRPAPGSNAFVPSVAGLIMAGEVIKDLMLLPRCNRSERSL